MADDPDSSSGDNPDDQIEIFISYSHADMDLKTKLIRTLKPLDRKYNISEWHDGKILAGNKINQEILKHLSSSQLVLLLVSTDFLNSDYCMETELKIAMERMEKGECIVIPVMLSPCMINEGHPFYDLERVPKDGKPITTYKNENDGLVDAATMIKDRIDDYAKDHVGILKVNEKISLTAISGNKNISHSHPMTAKRFDSDGHTILKETSQVSQPIIRLYSNDDGWISVPVDSFFLTSLPTFMRHLESFNDRISDELQSAKRRFSRQKKKIQNSLIKKEDLERYEASELRLFLMSLCSYTKEYITGREGFRIHFRGLTGQKYTGIVVITQDGEGDSGDDIEFSTYLTPIPVARGLIHYSQEVEHPLLKTLNEKENYLTRNNANWAEYLTYSLHNLTASHDAVMSFGIAVSARHYNENPVDSQTLFYQLAYLHFAERVEYFVIKYCENCRQVDRNYDVGKIVRNQFREEHGIQHIDR